MRYQSGSGFRTDSAAGAAGYCGTACRLYDRWIRDLVPQTEEIIGKGVSYRYEKETKTDDRNAAGTGGAGSSIPGHPPV